MKQILIIGAGSWGFALACSLKRNIILYSNDKNFIKEINNHEKPSRFENFDLNNINLSLIEATDKLDFNGISAIIFALPGDVILDFLCDIDPILKNQLDIPVISSMKSLCQQKFIYQILEENFPNSKIGIISGPNLASEIMEGGKAISSLSASFENNSLLNNIISGGNISYLPNYDLLGTSICGVIKNIAAIGAGIIKTFDQNNLMACYIEFVTREIVNILIKVGADPLTIISPAGIGDLSLSCYSTKTRNHSFGYDLAKFGHFEALEKYKNITIEGYNSVKEMILMDYYKDSRLIKKIHQIIHGAAKPESILDILY